MLKTLKRTVAKSLVKRQRVKALETLLAAGLPVEMKPALDFLATGSTDPRTEAVVQEVEARRQAIAAQGDKEVEILYSPKPGSAGTEATPELRPEPGKQLPFTMARVAVTGKDQKWGTALHLIAKGFGLTRGFELGTCAGISALYYTAAPSMKEFITVEGSEALAAVARESLQARNNAEVVNSLFDEAIDQRLPQLDGKIDLAYIDGHHEKVATIHYFNRSLPYLQPGGVVIFDDVSWSQDMRDAWNELSVRTEFSHAMDLGAIGVCILKAEGDDSDTTPQYWNLQPVAGTFPIGDPKGWNE